MLTDGTSAELHAIKVGASGGKQNERANGGGVRFKITSKSYACFVDRTLRRCTSWKGSTLTVVPTWLWSTFASSAPKAITMEVFYPQMDHSGTESEAWHK